MSKYDALDARTELEQAITDDLRSALEKRGFKVTHYGTADSHAPAGRPDIVASSRGNMLTFEVTTKKGAAQDTELNSIREHLNQIKKENPTKRCQCVFSAQETSKRMLDGIRDHIYSLRDKRQKKNSLPHDDPARAADPATEGYFWDGGGGNPDIVARQLIVTVTWDGERYQYGFRPT